MNILEVENTCEWLCHSSVGGEPGIPELCGRRAEYLHKSTRKGYCRAHSTFFSSNDIECTAPSQSLPYTTGEWQSHCEEYAKKQKALDF